jgi:hypothetical protein
MKVILVLQRGWVVVGDVIDELEDRLELANASVVRRWGTSRGLGQLALEGPQKTTVLDPCGAVLVHPLSIVMQIPCKEEAWK